MAKSPSKPPATDRLLATALSRWFRANARTLPWRGPIGAPRDPWAVLVSETMLQQTQVSRVLERFSRFMRRFPTAQSLAAAPEHDVLAEWAGLGYYRRARNLHAAAKMIVDRFDGLVPRTLDDLLVLPGVGRYTAGAVASIAFGDAAPIVDGNVARVLLRVHGREARIDDRETQRFLWEQAAKLAAAGAKGRQGAGVVNEAIMELGATVCLPAPAMPRCDSCPLRVACAASRAGTQSRIPRPKAAAERRTVYSAAALIVDARGRLLLERRGDDGMWAGLWQPPSIERSDRAPTRGELARSLGRAAAELKVCGGFMHMTTHREVEFVVFRVQRSLAAAARTPKGTWVEPVRLHEYGISNAHKRVLSMALSEPVRARQKGPKPAKRPGVTAGR